jgi:hypothetical protein
MERLKRSSRRSIRWEAGAIRARLRRKPADIETTRRGAEGGAEENGLRFEARSRVARRPAGSSITA